MTTGVLINLVGLLTSLPHSPKINRPLAAGGNGLCRSSLFVRSAKFDCDRVYISTVFEFPIYPKLSYHSFCVFH